MILFTIIIKPFAFKSKRLNSKEQLTKYQFFVVLFAFSFFVSC